MASKMTALVDCAKRVAIVMSGSRLYILLALLAVASIIFASPVVPMVHAISEGSESTNRNIMDNCCHIVDLNRLVENPPSLDEIDATRECGPAGVWCRFRPNLYKLIMSGTADSEHISILWYAQSNGSVGFHYHDKTESVYSEYESL